MPVRITCQNGNSLGKRRHLAYLVMVTDPLPMKITTFLLTAAILLSANLYASETFRGSEAFKQIQGTELLRYNETSSVPTFIKFHSMFQMEYELWEQWMMRTFYEDVEGVSLTLLKMQEDDIGMKHYRYRQLHNGIPVGVGTWIIHTNGNKVVSMNGNLIDKVNVSAPILSEA